MKSNPISVGITNVIKGKAKRQLPVMVSDMAWLARDKEEVFCLLVADGIPLAIAFKRAGFTAKGNSAITLFRRPEIQQRISAIIKARADSPPVSLPEITDMMKRVYAGAIHDAEYTPAYNAAFGLARLYGLVVDRAQLDVVRRPSREPDAPSEQALSSWIDELPPYQAGPQNAPLPAHSPAPIGEGPGLLIEATAFGSDLDVSRETDGGMPVSGIPEVEARGPAVGPAPAEGEGEFGNGAPTRPVTGTPHPGAHSARDKSTKVELGTERGPENEEGTTYPSAEDLF